MQALERVKNCTAVSARLLFLLHLCSRYLVRATTISGRPTYELLQYFLWKMPALLTLSVGGNIFTSRRHAILQGGFISSPSRYITMPPNLRRLRLEPKSFDGMERATHVGYVQALIQSLAGSSNTSIFEDVRIASAMYDGYSRPESVGDVRRRLDRNTAAKLNGSSMLITLVHPVLWEQLGSPGFVKYHTWAF